MFSPKTQLVRGSLILFCLFISLIKLTSQCDPPSQLPTNDCSTAPFTCIQDACYSTDNNPVFGYNGFCGSSTAIHNPQYFEVIPTQPHVVIMIHVDNCTSGAGLQAAFLNACPWDIGDVLDCDDGTNGCVGCTMTLDVDNLIPGQSYWFLIDGNAGAFCQYTITFAEGIIEPQIDEELMQGAAFPDVVCQGFDDLLLEVGPEIPNAHGYLWSFEWDNSHLTSTLTQMVMDLPNNAPPGIWDICVLAFSGCDTSEVPYCFEIEITEVDDVEKEPETFCPEEFPFNWHSVSIGGPGDYRQTFDTPEGCPYDSLWTVEMYPDPPVGEIDTLFCMNTNLDPFIYEGEAYDDAGLYEIEYDNMGLNGCDSTAELNLTLAGLDAFVELSCVDGEFILSVLIQELIPSNANVEFEWTDDSGAIVFDDNHYATLVGGTYSVCVTVETPAGECEFCLDPYFFDADALKPDAPLLPHNDTLICAQEGIVFNVIIDPFEDEYEYTWSGPPNVDIIDDGSGEVTMDFSASNGGEVCVYATSECGVGPTSCFNVEIIPTPIADFTYEEDVCSGESTIITFSGSASPDAELTWDFDNPASVTGSGEGPYTITWNITGDKVVNLIVAEPGCDTAYGSAIITVSNLLSPVINCSSTISSVSFDWTDVAGASGYLVSLNGSAPVMTTLSTYDTTGLSPGSVINLTLTVLSDGPCPDIVLMHECTAEDCPPPIIELSGKDSLCLNSPTTVDLEAEVNGQPGIGVWTGTGIVDPVSGEFDPKVSGPGQHQITFTTDVNGCDFSAQYLMTVFDSLTADFVVDPLICITDVANLTYTGNASDTDLFDFDFGPATIVSGSGSGPYQLRYANPGQKTVRLQVSADGCSSEIISHTVDVVAALNPPVVNCSPSTSDVEFTWMNVPGTSGFIVNTLSSHSGVQTGNSIIFTGLVPGDEVEIEIISQSAGPCPERRDTFLCQARDCPPVMLEATPVSDICLYPNTPTVTLEISITNGNGTGEWSGPGITDPAGTFDPNIAGAGAHQLTFDYVDDECDFVESITVYVFDPPSAFVSNTDFVLTCESNNMLVLDGSGSSGGPLNFVWSTTNGSFIGATNSAQVTVGKAGTYQLKVVTAATGCADSISVQVTQDANIPVLDAGPDKVLTCDSLLFVLGNPASFEPNVVYTWSTTNGNIVGSVSGLTITADKVGTYVITGNDTINGCQGLDEAIITIDTAVAGITLTPGNLINCSSTMSDVQSILTEPVSDYDLVWTTTDGFIVGDTTLPDIEVSQGGTYTLTITNKDNGCQKSASAVVDESDEIIDDVDVSLTNVVCFGDNNGALIVNSVTGGLPPYTYQWSVNSPVDTNLTSLIPGQYSLTVSDQNGCTFTQVFEITQPPKVTADVGPDRTVAGGDSVTINLITNVTAGAINTITWSGKDVVDCPECPTLQFVATSSGTIVAMVSDTSGCTALDSMRLTVLVPRIVFIPNVFSPNDDEINDRFFISGRPNLTRILFMEIFDRWGNQLFEAKDLTPGDENAGWDGSFNGQLVSPGVYVYVAKLEYEDGFQEVIKGGITVIK